jgi:hypothetical protein
MASTSRCCNTVSVNLSHWLEYNQPVAKGAERKVRAFPASRSLSEQGPLVLKRLLIEAPPNWSTPLLSSGGSGKVSNGPGTASFYG